ncbi:glycerophosphoryl diester phosphodiesterase membrane domain-containing protein [Actinomyces qiguomingii]|uniref:glycerophosphoryl diester phosphodiesterase membrane domain-containing protein n=1 Tax=Actinomyces qiguomingii TaxID=2057800 RepID=UPI000CA02FE5|nr:glycerophosphoryl diester phosphodiesterase membrane domain-containing protein [Actinomyces qiguomingii]
MSSENTGWQPPSDGDLPGHTPTPGGGANPSPPTFGLQAEPVQGATSGPQYGQYAQQAGANPMGPAGFFAAPKPGIIPLRPLSITEIIGGAFESLRANPRAMFLPALLVMGAAGLLSAVLTYVTMNSLFRQIESLVEYDPYDSSASEIDIFRGMFSLFSGVLGTSVVSQVITFLATTILTGLLIVTVSRSVLGRIATPAEVWERTRPRLLALIGQSILINVISALGALLVIGAGAVLVGGLFYATNAGDGSGNGLALFALLTLLLAIASVIATLFLYVRLSVSGAALILENVGVWEGIRRSWQLTRGNFWRVLGTLLLTYLIVSVISSILGGIVGFISGTGTFLAGPGASALLVAVSAFIGGLLEAAIRPFSSAATALIYIDLRMRQEGLDVELRRSAGASVV